MAALVFVAACAALYATRDPVAPRLESTAAAQAVLHDAEASRILAHGERWTSVRVTPVDRVTTRVSFFAGPRLLLEAAVGPRGHATRVHDYRGADAPFGAPLAQRGWLIALGCVAFALATAVVPLRRLRNLDVLALLSFVVALVLLNERLIVASTLAAVPPLLWLTARCAWLGLRPADAGAQASARPLLDALTPAWDDTRRVRMLRLAVGVAAAAVAMITLSAPTTVDVGQAVMEGATLLLHGTLPYGHLPGDVFHGDTYPLLSYVVYMPLAALMPVHDEWDVANGALWVSAASAIAVAALLARFARAVATSRAAQPRELAVPDAERAAGLRAALAWLVFPPLVVTVSSGTSDVLLALPLVGALVLSRRRLTSATLIVAAGWLKLVPFALLPIWLARLRGRQLAAALALLALTTLATVALLVALGGVGAPARMLHAIAFQLDRRTLHSPWSLVGIEWLQPLAQAAVLALVAGATVRVWRDRTLAEDPARLAAIAAAVLLGLQLCGNYWTYLYLAWALPCIVLSLLAPSPAPAPATARSDDRPVRAQLGWAIGRW
jgi:hypothetical protein